MIINVFKEFLAYLFNIIKPKADSCDVTIVRRYRVSQGWIGEVYVNGKQLGMSCDNFMDGQELIRHPLNSGYERGMRVLRTDVYCISRGDFTAKIPMNYAYIGCLEPKENDMVLSKLIDNCNGFKYLRLTVLNRPLVEA